MNDYWKLQKEWVVNGLKWQIETGYEELPTVEEIVRDWGWGQNEAEDFVDDLEIRREQGDPWAWCGVAVSVSFDGIRANWPAGSSSVFECTYANVEEFMRDPLFQDLCRDAMAVLLFGANKLKEKMQVLDDLPPLDQMKFGL